jgi:PAS domain S-box-containing protein
MPATDGAAEKLEERLHDFVSRWKMPWLWREFSPEDIGCAGPYHALGEDSRGNIWIGSDSGLSYYDGYSWNPTPMPPALSSGSPRRFVRDGTGRLLGRKENSLWSFSPGQVERLRLPELGDRPIRSMLQGEGEFFLRVDDSDSPRGRITYLWRAGQLTRLPEPFVEDAPHPPLFSVAGGQLYATHGSETWVLEDGQWRLRWKRRLRGITQTSTGRALVKLGGNQEDPLPLLLTWTKEDPRERVLGLDRSTSTTRHYVAVGEQILWLGTDGLCHLFDGHRFRKLQTPFLSMPPIRALRLDQKHNLWLISSDRVFLRLHQPPRWKLHIRRPPGQRSQFAGSFTTHSSTASPRGTLLIASRYGIEERSPEGLLLRAWPIELFEGLLSVTSVLEDREGRLWACGPSQSSFIWRFDGSRWEKIGAERGMLARRPRSLELGPDGQVWLGAQGANNLGEPVAPDCVFRWNGERFEAAGQKLGLREENCIVLEKGPEGTLWAGGWQGLHRWHAGRWTSWPLSGARGRRSIVALAPVNRERCWFGNAAHGLGVRDRNEPPHYLRSQTGGTGAVRAMSLALDARGRLWIGSSSGLWCMDGQMLRREAVLPSGLAHSIRALTILDERLHVGEVDNRAWVLDLRHESARSQFVLQDSRVSTTGNNLLVDWSVRTLYDTPRARELRYRFRIDDRPWSSWAAQRQLAVSGLSAGRHALAIEVLDPVSGSPIRVLEQTVADIPYPLHLQAGVLVPVALVLLLLGLALGWAIWQRRRIAEEVLQEQEYSRMLLESSAEGIFAIRQGGEIRAWNQGMERITGLQRSQVMGRPVLEVLPLARTMHEQLGSSSPLDGRSSEGDDYAPLLLSDPDQGRSYECQLSDVRDESGLSRGTICVVRDTTERLEMESRLRTSQKLEAVGTLASGLAHDVNNALQSILGYTDIARSSLDEPELLADSLAKLAQSAERTQGLTRTLLGFARPGKTERSTLDLGRFVAEMQQILRPLLPRIYELVVATNEELYIDGDVSGLQQLLINFVVNARDAMPDGGIIRVVVQRDDEQAMLAVIDSGVGIGPEIRDHILEPFFTTKPRGQGTGLGLAVVHWVLREHNGEIEILSSPGRGTEMRCRFPLLRKSPEQVSEASTGGTWTKLEGGGREVLCVEDDPQILAMTRDILLRQGFEVHCCETGTEAIALDDALRGRLAFAVLDFDLPGANGLEVLAHLRSTHPDLPVLLVSGLIAEHLGETDLDGVLQLGKPFRNHQFLDKIQQLLAQRGGS